MWCSECNISGGCDCALWESKDRLPFIPRDHKKELKEWEEWIHRDTSIEHRKN